jgi:hypothetical protein
MAEEQTQSNAPESSTEQTLDQVYQTYPVESTASEFNPQRQQQQPPQQQPTVTLGADIPDPVLDQAGFKAHLAKQDLSLRQALTQSTQLAQQMWVAEQRREEEAAIKNAVQTVKEKIGDIDDDFVEVALGQKARKDPKFNAIYQNRGKNPQAWKAALTAVANEFKGKYQFRQDSQLTENVRAARQSTQTSLTSKESASDNPIEKQLSEAKSDGDFARTWARFRG